MERFYSSLVITALIWAIFHLSSTSDPPQFVNQEVKTNSSDLILVKPESESPNYNISRRKKQQYWLIFPAKLR
jgi:hypothetical protein